LTDLAKASQTDETSSLLGKARSPLWLLIFPEGTIISDEERVKSVRYAQREGIDDLVTLLHPRSTGLLFCLRTLLPHIPDLKLLDVTIGYPGVPYGRYPQDYYGLVSVFFRSVPPPTVHLHLRLYSDLSSPDCGIPSLQSDGDLASPEESRAFELWLRAIWQAKEKRMEGFYKEHRFPGDSEAFPIREQ
jgi:lysocardiolipin and lysophospholipid acyltransferase